MSRSPSSYLVDEFDFLWRTGKLSAAAQLVKDNFERLPDPGPLRIAIAMGLLRHERKEDAAKILTKTIEHYICSGFFFRALAAYVLLRGVDDSDGVLSIPKIMWQTFGPHSEYIRRPKPFPRFPEPELSDLVVGKDVVNTFEGASDSELIDFIVETANSPYALKLSPGFVPKLPIFSEMSESVFLQLAQLVDIRTFESTQVVEEFEDGELVWSVGEDAFIRTEKEVFQLSSGTILGLQHYLPVTHEVPPFELIANYATFLRLPVVALQALKSTWVAADDDLRLLAYSSLLEQRLFHHSLISSIPLAERQKLVSDLNLRVIERGNILGVSDTENHLGGNSAASPFFLVLAGEVAVEALDLEENERPVSCVLTAPCIVGAFNFFLEESPTMVFRSLSHVLVVEMTSSQVQELVVEYPAMGGELTGTAHEILTALHRAARL